MRYQPSVLATIMALSGSPAAAEQHRVERPNSLSGGLSILKGDERTALPYLVLQGVHGFDARVALVLDAAYFTSNDRLFGPRMLIRGGARAYPFDAASLFMGANVAVYHEFDVDYQFSDQSQSASTSVGIGATLGHELVTAHGLSWTVEVRGDWLVRSEGRSAATRWMVQGASLLGYRF